MNTLAAAVIAAVLPLAAFAQRAPAVAPALSPATVMVEEAEPEGALDLGQYPRARRDELWQHYARKSVISVNLMYPISGAIFMSTLSAFWMGNGSNDPLGAFSIPFEYERSLSRGWSVFGVVQPTLATGLGETSFSCALGAGGRFYFTGNAPQGVWTGLEVDHALGSRALTVRSELGHNAIFDNGMTLSVGFGLGVTYAPDVVLPFTDIHVPILPAAGLRVSVGYSL